MHPSEFFENCSLRTGIDVFEIYDTDLKEKLKKVHPKNFLKTKITLPVYKVNLSYLTEKGNFIKVVTMIYKNGSLVYINRKSNVIVT